MANSKEDNQPLVSIVTPSYNQGQFIEDTIQSVKNQDYPNIEHIIVDGGSTDNTLEVLKKYESTYNMRWISEPDDGMYEAINKGLKMAKGEVLAYLNSDDLYFPWTVSTVVKQFLNNPEISVIYGDMINQNISTGEVQIKFSPPFNLNWLRRTGFLGQPSVFFNKNVIEKEGFFNENLKLAGDCEYWMRIGEKFRINKLNEFLAIERDHIDMQREKKKVELHKELRQIRGKYKNLNSQSYKIKTLFDRFYSSLWKRFFYIMFFISLYNPFYWKNLILHCEPYPNWKKLLLDFFPLIKRRDTFKFHVYFW